MFLYLTSHIAGGQRRMEREMIQAGPTHILWRGEPDEVYLYGLKQVSKLAARSGQLQCEVVHRQDSGVEFSYGAWWPFARRRLQHSLAKGWPRTLTIHEFPAAGPGGTGQLSIHWAPRHDRAVVTIEAPGCAAETSDWTMRDVLAGALDQLVADRGWPVLDTVVV